MSAGPPSPWHPSLRVELLLGSLSMLISMVVAVTYTLTHAPKPLPLAMHPNPNRRTRTRNQGLNERQQQQQQQQRQQQRSDSGNERDHLHVDESNNDETTIINKHDISDSPHNARILATRDLSSSGLGLNSLGIGGERGERRAERPHQWRNTDARGRGSSSLDFGQLIASVLC
mmetsp:Transcript_19571/g.34892  ORF Transcript_19571/g.34892 Transcript_19571/m.34892 type:complete len:173 (-) Transcript_19571:85-603(-)